MKSTLLMELFISVQCILYRIECQNSQRPKTIFQPKPGCNFSISFVTFWICHLLVHKAYMMSPSQEWVQGQELQPPLITQFLSSSYQDCHLIAICLTSQLLLNAYGCLEVIILLALSGQHQLLVFTQPGIPPGFVTHMPPKNPKINYTGQHNRGSVHTSIGLTRFITNICSFQSLIKPPDFQQDKLRTTCDGISDFQTDLLNLMQSFKVAFKRQYISLST